MNKKNVKVKKNEIEEIQKDNSNIVCPEYYVKDRQFEPIDVINDWVLSFNLSSAIKYLSRAGYKPGQDKNEDLKKAIFYIYYEMFHKKISKEKLDMLCSE